MLYKRLTAVATALVAACACVIATGASASAGGVSWTDQTVFAISPTESYVAEWMGLSSGWTIIGPPAEILYGGSAGLFALDVATGDITEYNGTPGSWTEIGGPGGGSSRATATSTASASEARTWPNGTVRRTVGRSSAARPETSTEAKTA